LLEGVLALDAARTIEGVVLIRFAVEIHLFAAGQSVIVLHFVRLVERLVDDFLSPPRIGRGALTIAVGGEFENGGRRRRRSRVVVVRGVDEGIVGTVGFRHGVVAVGRPSRSGTRCRSLGGAQAARSSHGSGGDSDRGSAADGNDALFGLQAHFGRGGATSGSGHLGVGASSARRGSRPTRRSASIPWILASGAVAAVGRSGRIPVGRAVVFDSTIATARTIGNCGVEFVLGSNGRRIRLGFLAIIAIFVAAALFQLVVVSIGSSRAVHIEEFVAVCHVDCLIDWLIG